MISTRDIPSSSNQTTSPKTSWINRFAQTLNWAMRNSSIYNPLFASALFSQPMQAYAQEMPMPYTLLPTPICFFKEHVVGNVTYVLQNTLRCVDNTQGLELLQLLKQTCSVYTNSNYYWCPFTADFSASEGFGVGLFGGYYCDLIQEGAFQADAQNCIYNTLLDNVTGGYGTAVDAGVTALIATGGSVALLAAISTGITLFKRCRDTSINLNEDSDKEFFLKERNGINEEAINIPNPRM